MKIPYTCAIYPYTDTREVEKYLDRLEKWGCGGVFTSLHMPETQDAVKYEFLKFLIREAHARNMEVCADMGGQELQIGVNSQEYLPVLQQLDSLRLDSRYTSKEVEALHAKLPETRLVINASALTEETLHALDSLPVFYDACHNFYPRPQSGLDREFIHSQNRIFQQRNIPVTLCLPCYEYPKGPLRQGLPTLEEHRWKSLQEVLTDSLMDGLGDMYLFGDEFLSEESLEIIHDYLQEDVLSIRIRFVPEVTEREKELITKQLHQFRYDSGPWAWRAKGSRKLARLGDRISPRNLQQRPRGTVTLDNEKYGHSSGEMQVVRQDMDADEKVNVVAHVIEEDLMKLELFQKGMTYRFTEVESPQAPVFPAA